MNPITNYFANRCFCQEASTTLVPEASGCPRAHTPIIDSTMANCSFFRLKKSYNSSIFSGFAMNISETRLTGTIQTDSVYFNVQLFFMNSKSRQSHALLHVPVCFPAPCVEEEKQEGKTEHKLSDAWTYEYLSVNASRWPWITQTECPGRVPHLLGDLYDHEMISRQDGFREIDPFVFGLTPPGWCMIAVIICVKTWFVSS